MAKIYIIFQIFIFKTKLFFLGLIITIVNLLELYIITYFK